MLLGRYLVSIKPFTTLTFTSQLSQSAQLHKHRLKGDIHRHESQWRTISNASAMAKSFPTNPSTHQNSTKTIRRQRQDNGKTRTCAPKGIWIATRRDNHSATLSCLLWRSGLLWLILLKTVSPCGSFLGTYEIQLISLCGRAAGCDWNLFKSLMISSMKGV